VLQYDEQDNLRRLTALEPPLRVAFALLCAGRLLPTYSLFHGATGRGDPGEVQRLWERAWHDLTGAPMSAAEVAAFIVKAELLVPSEDDGYDEETQPYAEDAASALAYALRARANGDPREAAWAGQCLYEAADHFAGQRISGQPATPTYESEALTHPVVQQELGRQHRDLLELLALPAGGDRVHRLAEMRARSEHEANAFFIPSP
jgi:hypothetical protein